MRTKLRTPSRTSPVSGLGGVGTLRKRPLRQRSSDLLALAALAAALTTVALTSTAFAQNSNLSEHERAVKAESDRNTAYHNNADDYPASDQAGNAAIAARIANSFKSTRTPTAAEDARRKDQEWNAEYERKEAILNRFSASAANGNLDAELAVAGMYARGEGTRPLPQHALDLYSLIGERQPDGFYYAALLLLDGGTAATDWMLARDEPRAISLMRKAAARGSVPARNWLAANASDTASTGAPLPGIDHFFDATMRAYARSATPTDPKRNQKLLDESVKAQHFNGPTEKRDQIYSALRPNLSAAGIATLFGVGLPADPVTAEKLFTYTPTWWSRTDNPAFLAYIQWTAEPGTPATYHRLDDYLSDHSIPQNGSYLVDYVRALVAAGTNNSLRERQILTAAANTSSVAGIQMMVDLAAMQLEGRGGPKDEAAGLAALNTAAAKGSYNAQYVLGLIYEKGLHGVLRDTARATQLFAAAAVGQPAAQAHLSGNLASVALATKP